MNDVATTKPSDLPTLTGWGLTGAPGEERHGEDLLRTTEGATLTRGLGRSYGDSSLPAPGGVAANSVLADRLIAFDPETGVLRAEAGLSLYSLVQLFLHRGYFLPVTPGTQFVTLGGMVASDVHGKNHHVAGTFGRHVTALKIRVASGEIVECDREVHPDLFLATIGGMGLTGHILEVEFRMDRIPSPWIFQETFQVSNIDAYVDGLKDSAADWPMTMGWIDCLSKGDAMGRGILMRGRWAQPHEAPKKPPTPKSRITLPPVFPSWTINDLTVKAFNWLYYNVHIPERKSGIVHPESFFYPLDALRLWNRAYGASGFTQYQCVLPNEAGRGAARRFLELLTSRGGASMLCVIKDCGEEGEGILSFPMPGISIAIDFPIRKNTPALVAALNAFVIREGGRIYLTKDTFTTREHFAAMEPRLERFMEIRRRWDPELSLRSAQSVRIFGDPAR